MLRPAALRVVAGEQDVSVHERQIAQSYFCKHCGIHVYGRGHLQELGGDFASVNVATLDLTPHEFAQIPVRYCDGRNDNWMNPPAVISYL